MVKNERKKPDPNQGGKSPDRISRRQFALSSIALLGSTPLALSDTETAASPFKLKVSEEVRRLMADRHILDEDLIKVIEYAEKTGDKLYRKDCGRLLAKLKLYTVYFYAEYSPVEGGFEIHNTYSHRFTLEGTM